MFIGFRWDFSVIRGFTVDRFFFCGFRGLRLIGFFFADLGVYG